MNPSVHGGQIVRRRNAAAVVHLQVFFYSIIVVLELALLHFKNIFYEMRFIMAVLTIYRL